MNYTRVESKVDVAALATGLSDPARDRPWVVVSTRFGETRPEIQIDDLTRDVSDIARIFLIVTGELTYELSDLLPDRFQVYGGAGRSYPTGPTVFDDPRRSALRFAYGHPERATERLIADALGHAHEAGLFEQHSASSVAVTGTVRGFLGGSRAWVELAGGGMATVWQELTFPPVPLDWTLRLGQQITGLLDQESKRLTVEGEAPSRARLTGRFRHNDVTLALVQQVGAQAATLVLHPKVAFTLIRADISPNPRDTVTSLLSEGDVVAVRVLHQPAGGIRLRMSDVDDDEPIVPPLSLVDHGPAWLQENRPLLPFREPEPTLVLPLLPRPAASHSITEFAPVSHPADASPPRAEPLAAVPAPPHPRPGPGPARIAGVPVAVTYVAGVPSVVAPVLVSPVPVRPPTPVALPASSALLSTQLSLQRAKTRIRELEQRAATRGPDDAQLADLRGQAYGAELQLREMRLELGTVQNTLEHLRDELREEKKLLRESRRAFAKVSVTDGFDVRRRRFADPVDWIRHETYLAWIERISPTERAEWPLPPDYRVGEAFADSLDPLEDGQLAKVFKCAVDALTGRIRDLGGRQLHHLRTGDGAGSGDVVRADGARCLRASIEQNTPAARRLHYWQLVGGAVELGRVVTHDDMRP